MSQRFSVKGELSRIDSGLVRDAQKEWGTTVEWFRFDPVATDTHDIYDVGAARRWQPSLQLPVLWVTRDEGEDRGDPDGLTLGGSLQFAVSKTTMRDKLHWLDLDQAVKSYLKDRVRFEGEVYTVQSFQLLGQLLDRDTVIGVLADRVREEQHLWDPDFSPAPPP